MGNLMEKIKGSNVKTLNANGESKTSDEEANERGRRSIYDVPVRSNVGIDGEKQDEFTSFA